MTAEPLRGDAVDRRVAAARAGLWVVTCLGTISLAPVVVAVAPEHSAAVAGVARSALVVPLAVALALTYRERPQRMVMAAVAAAALTMAVPLLLVSLAFALGLQSGHPRLTSIFLLALAATLVIAGVLAVRAARAPGGVGSPSWATSLAVGSSFAYSCLAALAFLGTLPELPVPAATTRLSGDAAGKDATRAIASCARAYAAANPARGFPSSMTALASGDGACLDPDVAAGEAHGFRFEYIPGLADANGAIHVFKACAQPVVFRQTGTYTHVTDESGADRESVRPEDDRRTPLSCREGWYFDMANAIEYCALRYAAAHPEKGYPASLADVGTQGDGCMAVRDWMAEPGRNSVEGSDDRFTYVAGEADTRGRITTYEIHIHGIRSRARRNAMENERGERHEVRGPRLATPNDPATPPLVDPDTDTLERACLAGDANACWRQGLAIANDPTSPVPPAVPFRRGCEGGSGEACFELARLRVTGDNRLQLLERACEHGAGRGCAAVAEALAADSTAAARVTALLARGCEAGDPGSCTRLADRLMASEPARARRLMVRGCAVLDDKKCNDYR